MYIKFNKAESEYGYDVEIHVNDLNYGVIWFNSISATMAFIAGAFKEQIDLNKTSKFIVKSGSKDFLERINRGNEKKAKKENEQK